MILIVDDHKDNAELLQRLLRSKGYAAACAFCGADALAYLHTTPAAPNLVILDDMMPDQSGLDVLRCLRCDARLAELPVLFFSASADPVRLREAEGLGARGWLVKGSDTWETLLRHVTEVLPPPPSRPPPHA